MTPKLDLHGIVESIVREHVDTLVKQALGQALTPASTPAAEQPTAKRSNGRLSADDRRIGPRVNYWLTKAGRKAHAGDSLASNNAKVFRYVAKHEGKTKAQIAAATDIPPHSCESNINQLQQLGLIESRPVA